MWTTADIADAINGNADVAVDALAAVMLDAAGVRLDPAGLDAAARMFGRDRGAFWVEQIDGRGLLPSFALALSARGVAIDHGAAPLATGNVAGLGQFDGRARAFRCRIRRDRQVVGSGVLIGPRTVLTAWHVISGVAPGQTQQPPPELEVELADGRRLAAHLPALWQSPCTADEFASRLPPDDAAANGADDVAVLRLERPAGAVLGAAPLPATPAGYVPNASVFVVHYPEGADVGLGVGAMSKIRGLAVRWAHSVASRPGSSGGGCFDASLTLAGIHQGRDPQQQGRLVPTARFFEQVRAEVARDQAPARMWSLDETPEGEFVIGRQGFFEAFALARGEGRVRGVRVKRADAAGDPSGLPFTYRMLQRMVARSPDVRECRLSFETLVPDLADDIARRASEVVPAVAVAPAPGVAAGESAPEAVGADRGRRLATAIDRRAAEVGVQLWFFVDHPAIAFGDEQRATLEGFIDQALRLPRLRFVVAGFEAVALPGLQFDAPPLPTDGGAPGMMVEVVSGFARSDVRLFVQDAAAAAGRALDDAVLGAMADDALDGLAHVNGVYESWRARDVAERLRPAAAKLFAKPTP